MLIFLCICDVFVVYLWWFYVYLWSVLVYLWCICCVSEMYLKCILGVFFFLQDFFGTSGLYFSEIEKGNRAERTRETCRKGSYGPGVEPATSCLRTVASVTTALSGRPVFVVFFWCV